jgi:hypothetical protein
MTRAKDRQTDRRASLSQLRPCSEASVEGTSGDIVRNCTHCMKPEEKDCNFNVDATPYAYSEQVIQPCIAVT